MLIKSELINGLALAVASTSILGGGTMVLTAHRDNSVQDAQIHELQRNDDKLALAIEKLNETASSLDRNVAVLNERTQEK